MGNVFIDDKTLGWKPLPSNCDIDLLEWLDGDMVFHCNTGVDPITLRDKHGSYRIIKTMTAENLSRHPLKNFLKAYPQHYVIAKVFTISLDVHYRPLEGVPTYEDLSNTVREILKMEEPAASLEQFYTSEHLARRESMRFAIQRSTNDDIRIQGLAGRAVPSSNGLLDAELKFGYFIAIPHSELTKGEVYHLEATDTLIHRNNFINDDEGIRPKKPKQLIHPFSRYGSSFVEDGVIKGLTTGVYGLIIQAFSDVPLTKSSMVFYGGGLEGIKEIPIQIMVNHIDPHIKSGVRIIEQNPATGDIKNTRTLSMEEAEKYGIYLYRSAAESHFQNMVMKRTVEEQAEAARQEAEAARIEAERRREAERIEKNAKEEREREDRRRREEQERADRRIREERERADRAAKENKERLEQLAKERKEREERRVRDAKEEAERNDRRIREENERAERIERLRKETRELEERTRREEANAKQERFRLMAQAAAATAAIIGAAVTIYKMVTPLFTPLVKAASVIGSVLTLSFL